MCRLLPAFASSPRASLLPLLLIMLLSSQASSAAIPTENLCPEDYISCSGICYRYVSTRKNYDDAEQHCVAMGATLPLPRTGAESRCVDRLTTDDGWGFIGVTDRQEEGLFVAADGTPAEQLDSRWDDGDFRNSAGRDCVVMGHSGDSPVWYVVRCAYVRPFLCQRPPRDDPAGQLLPRPPTCGQRRTRRTDVTTADRVAGGEPVLRGEFPWQAQIRSLDRSRGQFGAYAHTCGGVIISDRFVLTAAHCMFKALREYEVVVGQYDLRVKESSERVFAIKEKLDVPDYLANGTKVGDLAVLKLDLSNRPAITFSTEVRPACLIRPEDPAPAPHSACVISGWGSTLPGGGEFPSRLRGAEVPIVTDDFCRSSEVYGHTFIPDKMICAGFVKGGVDTCQGDSGGGLVCPAPDGSWQVVGIVATGDAVCGAVAKPGIYTELQPYYEKILDIIKALS